MTLNSRSFAAILVTLVFGGIVISMLMGWWAASPDSAASTFTEGEFAGKPNPSSIRGMNTLEQVADQYGVPAEVLIRAFNLPADTDPKTFKLSGMESMNTTDVEIGPTSVRIFVALYAALPYELSGESSYLPRSAVDILKEHGDLTPEQVDYLDRHTVQLAGGETIPQPAAVETPVPSESVSIDSANTVKGKTTFGELLAWGVPQNLIEKIISVPMPDPATAIKDFASANNLDFEVLKTALQAEVDKVKK
jgi:hypothetical protein